jgi:DNA-directed RNA polymerase subunit M/transcription elongation factor TFIIS
VKKYHPDTATNDSDLDKFHLLDQAYKELQMLFASQAKAEQDCEGEYGLYYKTTTTSKDSCNASFRKCLCAQRWEIDCKI